MKQKIKLDELRIQSFITELDPARADKAKGGSMYGGNSYFYGEGNCGSASTIGGGSYGTGNAGDNTTPWGGGGTGGQAPDYSFYCSQDYDGGGRCI